MSTALVNTAVLKSEIRLFRREPGALFWILVFPTLLLVILGSIPSFREADPDFGGLRPVDGYVPVSVLLGLIMAGVQAMPQTLTGYRERGILRRMSTTPVRPAALLSAHMLLFGGAAVVSARSSSRPAGSPSPSGCRARASDTPSPCSWPCSPPSRWVR